jgi:hypothetical protein
MDPRSSKTNTRRKTIDSRKMSEYGHITKYLLQWLRISDICKIILAYVDISLAAVEISIRLYFRDVLEPFKPRSWTFSTAAKRGQFVINARKSVNMFEFEIVGYHASRRGQDSGFPIRSIPVANFEIDISCNGRRMRVGRFSSLTNGQICGMHSFSINSMTSDIIFSPPMIANQYVRIASRCVEGVKTYRLCSWCGHSMVVTRDICGKCRGSSYILPVRYFAPFAFSIPCELLAAPPFGFSIPCELLAAQ